ncbi:DUF2637 domain-containing protein [Streptomyces boncukensis]|uniref:DUF2637 domain-containing protein n=1 Tax=Streptomyces boncukensis TaxID=2711219 RepID=A0A6G4X4V5_9ACTN|nr:DUF2637 domain-containing protein [Streptomyces boncukensis]NGO72555.1 DUF2637 domain-containing protein [Streptomyces boncukensis]
MTRSFSFRSDAVLVQAVIAGALSFAHLHDIAVAAGQDGWKAWAYPISVDLLLVVAWRRLRDAGPSRLAWCWFLIALFASLGANVATAGFLDLDHPPAWLRFLVAGWPALAFLGGTLLAHTAAPTKPAPVVKTAPEPDGAPAPVEGPGDSAAPRAVSERPVPPVPAPAPVPVSGPAAPPAPGVPSALLDHARKLAGEHHIRTGTAIDAATLRTRLGIPEPLAQQIVTQLA